MKGIFLDGRVRCLEYNTRSCKGIMENGVYEYENGEEITFSALGLVLGSCIGKEHITPVDLVEGGSLDNETVLTIMRFLMLFSDGSPSSMISVTGAELRGAELTVGSLEAALGVSLPYVSKCRNRLRRATWGMIREKNVRVPMSDGTYLAANIFRPFAEGRYPTIITQGAFGMVFYKGWDGNAVSEKYYDDAEDGHYSIADPRQRMMYNLQNFGSYYAARMGGFMDPACPLPRVDPESVPTEPHGPDLSFFEGMEHVTHFECPDVEYWCRNGYAVVLVDERGCGSSPGFCTTFGYQNGVDYAESVEWAARQPWSNGNVGSYGASYYAMSQYPMAQYQPEGLKAMIAISGDFDSYEHYVYNGNGLFGYSSNFRGISKPPSDWVGEDWLTDRLNYRYYEDDKYGQKASCSVSSDISKVVVPIIIACEGPEDIHTKGSNAAFHRIGSKDKIFWMNDSKGVHFWMYEEPFLSYSRRFFDKYLKGDETGIMDEPRVSLKLRGNGSAFKWRHEADWPVPETEYVRMFLDCNKNSIEKENPTAKGKVTYNADVLRSLRPAACRGAEFISFPFEKDCDIGGIIRMGMWVSSSTCDMEMHIRITAVDESGENVAFKAHPEITHGSSLASHNRKDSAMSDEFITVNKHRLGDCPPLTPDEPVFCEFDLIPSLVSMRKGWRLKAEIDPICNEFINPNEEAYRPGSRNSVYSGGSLASWIRLPILPE